MVLTTENAGLGPAGEGNVRGRWRPRPRRWWRDGLLVLRTAIERDGPRQRRGPFRFVLTREIRSWQSEPMTRPGRSHLRRRAFRLEYVTVLWNTLEGVASIAAGLLAGSVSLVAFGLDSSVEVFASLVVIWELRGVDRGRERRALRLIGVGYLVVAIYVAWDASRALLIGAHPAASPAGMILLAATVLVMATLGVAKLRSGGCCRARLSGRTVGSASSMRRSRSPCSSVWRSTPPSTGGGRTGCWRS